MKQKFDNFLNTKFNYDVSGDYPKIIEDLWEVFKAGYECASDDEANKIITYWTVDNTSYDKDDFWFTGGLMHSTREEAENALIVARERMNRPSIKWRIAKRVIESNPTTTTWRTESYEEFPCLS
jgi:hypothetical protein